MYYIFGGNGFVGRYLAKELAERGDKVTVCDVQDEINPMLAGSGVEYAKVDITKSAEIAALPIGAEDIAINMAANQYHTKVPKNKEQYFNSVNVEGTRNILAEVFKKGCRKYLMFSTDMTYGKPQYLPVDTRHQQCPFGPYGNSKKLAEDICREYRAKGMDITIMRPRMINGPGRLGILTKLFKLIDLGLPVPTIGNGRNHYQMISVFDCVSAAIAAIDKGLPNKEYNLGSKDSPDINTLLRSLVKEAGSRSFVMGTPGKLVKGTLAMLEKLGLPLMYKEQYMIADEEYILDISETTRDLAWEPRYNDADMIKEAYKAYKAQ